MGNDVNDDLTGFGDFVSVLGEGGVYGGLKHNGELLMINYFVILHSCPAVLRDEIQDLFFIDFLDSGSSPE